MSITVATVRVVTSPAAAGIALGMSPGSADGLPAGSVARPPSEPQAATSSRAARVSASFMRVGRWATRAGSRWTCQGKVALVRWSTP